MVSKSPELVLALGDLAHQTSPDCFFSEISPIDSITKIIIGNHDDKTTESLNEYMQHFGLISQYYSFNYQNVHFLVMSTELPYGSGSAQYNFVNSDLQSASTNTNINWIVVLFHKASYTSPSNH